MSKHTPGPWNIIWEKQDKDWVIEKTDGSMEPICWVRESQANAKLIAAAPDLLRALELIVNSDMAQREEDEGEISTELSHARAAIAKATGEPQ